jgi:hypothetical protein
MTVQKLSYDKKFKSESDYIEAFKKFLNTGILPILIFIFFQVFLSCKQNIDNTINPDITKNISNDSLIQNVKLTEALKRIYKFDNGIGDNVEVQENYEKEKETWLKEIDIVYKLLCEKIKNENPDNLLEFEKYHNDWKIYNSSKKKFETNYIRNYYTTGEYIFYIMPYFRNDYENKLNEYYSLLDIDNDN